MPEFNERSKPTESAESNKFGFETGEPAMDSSSNGFATDANAHTWLALTSIIHGYGFVLGGRQVAAADSTCTQSASSVPAVRF